MARPKLEKGRKSVTVQVRLTPEEKARFLAMGGSKALRKMIAEASSQQPEKRIK